MKFLLKTSTVADGGMSREFEPEEAALENRRKFLNKNGFPREYVYAELEHGNGVAVVGENEKGTIIKADALVTSMSDISLMLTTADCFPIAYHDPAAKVIALAHLGWKSSDLGLAGKVVREMQKLGSKPEDIRVFIGPGIQKESYLVENPAQKGKPEWAPFLERSEPVVNFAETKAAPAGAGIAKIYYRVDLIGFNKQALTSAGVRKENISVSPADTAVSPEYFSHRRAAFRGAAESRFATAVCLQQNEEP